MYSNFVNISKPMRKFFLTASFLALAPISFILGLILILTIYTQSAHLVTSGQTATYAALPSTQNVLGASISEIDGSSAEKIRQFLVYPQTSLKCHSELDMYALDKVYVDASVLHQKLCLKVVGLR